MIIGIHQPNYLPGISYFSKIVRSDVFIFLDSVQFTKGNWTNRNRIKSPQGELLLSIPVFTKGKGFQLIREMEIANRVDWRNKHLKSIYQNYSKAPYFKDYFPLLEDFYKNPWENIAEMNCYLIKKICDHLRIAHKFYLSSELDGGDLHSTDLLVFLVGAVGGDAYLSGLGGKKYMETEKFAANQISLHYLKFNPIPYRQQHGEFIANLSIIDLLFNEGPNSLRIIQDSARVL